MANGEYEIDEATFKSWPTEQQNWVMFTTFNKYRDNTDIRLKSLENRKKLNTAVAATSGFGGGFLAVFLKSIFK